MLANTPMGGAVRLTFRREPSYFAAAPLDGDPTQVVACRDGETGRVVGFGVRSLRRLYVNGVPETVGYLSGLRLIETHRDRGLVARGYAYFRRLHADGRAVLYVTTIAEGNVKALAVLTSGKAGLPGYHAAGTYRTLAVPLRRGPVGRSPFELRPAVADDVPAILAFLKGQGPNRQFFPAYGERDLFAEGGALMGLRPDDLLLAFERGRLVGTLGGWDLHPWKQTVVDGYPGAMGRLRPLAAMWAWLRGLPPLPPPGGEVRYLCAALPVTEGGRAEVFEALLRGLVARRAGGATTHLVVGLHDDDPLLPAAVRHAAACYSTRLFHVCFADGEERRRALDGRPPYLELGSL